jgi:hypothetical protein
MQRIHARRAVLCAIRALPTIVGAPLVGALTVRARHGVPQGADSAPGQGRASPAPTLQRSEIFRARSSEDFS